MNFDLFDDAPTVAAPAPVVAAPAPAPAPAPAGLKLEYMMDPLGPGHPNRWRWRGVVVGCDMSLQGRTGHWFTVDRVGGEFLKSDLRVELLKQIARAQEARAAR